MLYICVCVCVRGGGGGGGVVCMLMFVCVHLCVSVIDQSVNSLSYVCSQQGDISLAFPPPPKKKKKIQFNHRLVQQKTTALQMPRPVQNDQLQPYGHTGASFFVFVLSPLPGISL